MQRFILLLLVSVNGIFLYAHNGPHSSPAAGLHTDKQLWFGYFQQGRFHKHWGYWLDIHHRTKNDFAKNLHMEIFRPGVTYYVKDNLRLTLGYAFVMQFPSLTDQVFLRLEHRPSQQVQYVYNGKNFRAVHAVRSEQRFLRKLSGETLEEGYHFRQRFRYNYMLIFLFNKKEFKRGSVGIALNNEVFINAYSSDKVKVFDQNRAFAGLCYQLTDALQLQLGYLNVFAFTPKGNELVHGIRLFAFHTIDWRKKK